MAISQKNGGMSPSASRNTDRSLECRGAAGVLLALMLAMFTATASLAQTPQFLAQGDIVSAGSLELRIMDDSGQTDTGHTMPINPTTVLQDPANPDSFVIGSGSSSPTGGLLVRGTFTAPGNLVTTSLVPQGFFSPPRQLSWSQNGQEVIVVTTYGRVHSVDATTGVVTDIVTGTPPWGLVSSAGAIDPVTGDIYVGTTSGEIWRIASGTGGITPFLSGFDAIEKILFDDGVGRHHLVFATTTSLRRVDLSSAPVVETFFGTLGTPSLNSITAAAIDDHGDFVIGRSNNEVYVVPNVATVPPGGIAPTFLGQYTFTNSTGWTRDLCVVGGTVDSFRLTMTHEPDLSARFEIDNVPTPLGFGWFFLSASTLLPVDTGPFFGLVPDAATLLILQIPAVPGGLFAFTSSPPVPHQTESLATLPILGQTWDGVVVAFAPDGRYLGRSNLQRITW